MATAEVTLPRVGVGSVVGGRRAAGWALGLGLLVVAVAAAAAFSTRLAVLGAGLAIFLVSLREPRAGLALVALAIVLSPEIPVGGVSGTRLEDGLIALVGGAWLIRRVVGLENTRREMVLAAPLAAYVGVGLVGTLWGELMGTARLLSVDVLYGALPHLLKRVELALLAVVAARALRGERDVRRLAYLLMAALVAFCVYTWSHFGETGFSAEAPPGAAGHEAGLGGVLLLALTLGLLAHSRGWSTAAGMAPLGVALVTIPLSLGRNFTLTAGILLLAFAAFRKRWFFLVILVAVWAGLQWLPAHVIDRIGTLRWMFAEDPTGAATQGASVLSRVTPPLYFAQVALFNSPVFGFGLASLPLGFIDSEYATQLYFTGLLGVGVFAWMVTRVLRVWRGIGGQTAGWGRVFRSCFGYVLLAYAVYSLFSPSVSAARAGALFFLLAGMAAASAHRGRNEQA